VNGFITADQGIKMSKTLGNVADPRELVAEYGTDALRYFLLREISSFEDSPFTLERFKEAYNSGLANGLGNLVSRVMKMATTNVSEPIQIEETMPDGTFVKYLNEYNIQKATELIWMWVGELDATIQQKEPFKLIKSDPEEGKKIIIQLVHGLANIAFHLRSILPKASQEILELIYYHQNPEKPLFLRKD
jgi:methionyl-tRNA synthetase